MSEAVKKALEVAAEATWEEVDRQGEIPPDDINARNIAAAAIAAFLRALPEGTAYTMMPLPLGLAAAVEREARDAG